MAAGEGGGRQKLEGSLDDLDSLWDQLLRTRWCYGDHWGGYSAKEPAPPMARGSRRYSATWRTSSC